MTDKHLIVLDLDGTLLKDDKTISPRTKNVLQTLQNNGHEVMIATGRPYRSSEPYYREMQFKTPIVNFNGAFIHHPLHSGWGMHHSPLDIKVAKEIVEALNNYRFHNIIAEVKDDVYFHYHDEKLIDIFQLGSPSVTTGDLRQFLQAAPTSMLIHSDENDVAEIRQHLSDVHAEVIDHRRWADPWHVIEIVKSGLSKAVGVDLVAKDLGVSRKNIIAFGDEDNDLEMLDYVGTGVAMGNGIEQLKTVANQITLSNEEDGIAVFLEEKFNIKSA